MQGEIIQVGSDLALTKWRGRYHLWEPEGGSDYTRDVKPEGFETERQAREYAVRKQKIQPVQSK